MSRRTALPPEAPASRFRGVLFLFLLLLLLALALTPTGIRAAKTPEPASPQNPFLRIAEESLAGLSLELRIPPSAIGLENLASGFSAISIDKMGFTLTPGQPELPVVVATVAVPEGAEIRLSQRATGELTFDASPVQPVAGQDRENGGMKREADPGIYELKSAWPPRRVELEELRFRGLRLARISIYPARYDPLEGKIHVSHGLDVRVDFTSGKGFLAAEGPLGLLEERLVDRQLLNSRTVRTHRAPARKATARPLAAPKAGLNPAIKIRVAEEGLVRVTHGELAAAGFDPGVVDPRNLEVSYRGQAIPCRVVGEDDGVFDVDDAVEFYGLPGTGRFSRENVYWLEELSEPSAARYPSRAATPDGAPTAALFPHLEHYEEGNSIYSFGQPAKEGDPHLFWVWFENNPNPPRVTSFTHSATLPGVDPAGSGARIRAFFSGRTNTVDNPDHHVKFFVNDVEVGEVTWNGQLFEEADIPFDASLLVAGTNDFRLEFVPISIVDIYYMDWVEVVYPRDSLAFGSRLTVTGNEAGPVRYQVGGLDGIDDVVILDITDPHAPVELTGYGTGGSGPFDVTFEEPSSVGHQYHVVGDGGRIAAAGLELDVPTNYRDPGNGADLIIVVPDGWQSILAPLKAHREAQGLRVALISLTDAADEFGGGNVDDLAIKELVSYAYHNWQPPAVSYLLLVGEPNLDVLNDLGEETWTHTMPSHLGVTASLGETMTDTWFGAVSGTDLLPDVAVGRFSTSNTDTAHEITQKLIEYETAPPLTLNWGKRAMLVAGNEEAFEVSLELAAESLPDHFSVFKEYRRLGATGDSIRGSFITGVIFASYIGHGNVPFWADNPGGPFFRGSDAESITNSGRLPFITALNCLNGFVGHPTTGKSLAESFHNMPRPKGAIAMWSPSSLGFLSEYNVLQRVLYRTFFADNVPFFGAATTSSLVETYLTAPVSLDLVKEMILVGDPSGWLAIDADNDRLSDFEELQAGMGPGDRDSDDDGLTDINEGGSTDDFDGDGIVNGLDPDSDNDGVLDGTEASIVTPDEDTDLSVGNFRADRDPTTFTRHLDPDHDNGGAPDGAEDRNGNGQRDAGETNPRNGDDDPVCGQGPPAEIAAVDGERLRVEKLGENLVLNWGDATAVEPCILYRVYVADDFDPTTGRAAFRLLTVTGLPTFTHLGAAEDAAPHRYLVVGATLAGEGAWGHFEP